VAVIGVMALLAPVLIVWSIGLAVNTFYGVSR
jgi:hypothetical protein